MYLSYLQRGCDPGSRESQCVLHGSQLWMGTGRSVCGSCGASSRTGPVCTDTFYTQALHSWARTNTQPLDVHVSPAKQHRGERHPLRETQGGRHIKKWLVSHNSRIMMSYNSCSTATIKSSFTEILLQLYIYIFLIVTIIGFWHGGTIGQTIYFVFTTRSHMWFEPELEVYFQMSFHQ